MELFTVVVPVLNRVHTIGHTLLSCLVQNDERFQILVSDNHSSDGTYEELLRWAARDARITLIRPPCRMGQATHWEFALEHVREGYFMFLGGDDALLPRCMDRARSCLAAHPGVKALHSPICATYLYPDVHGERAGCLTTWPKVEMELRDSGEWLRRVIGGECGILELPYPYAFAWCHLDVLDEVRKKGRLIPCRTPPVFLALAAARYSSQFLMVSPGFAAPGVSRESIGYSCQFPGGDRAQDRKFFHEEDIVAKDIPYHPKVGVSRSEHMHVGETLLRAKEAGVLDDSTEIAWDRLVALAYRELAVADWSVEDRQANFASLQTVARNFGCEAMLPDSDEKSNMDLWMKQLPFELPKSRASAREIVIDLKSLDVQGVHQAAHLGDEILEALVCSKRDTPHVMHCDMRSLSWCFTQIVKEIAASDEVAELSKQLELRIEESNRRAAERDKAKQMVVELKERLKKTKSNPAKPFSKLGARLKRLFSAST